ncbi:MAG: hypothetical protein K2Y40_20865 [Reyranella sp.]|nr:hypothetical protein [Reyranella sp.]
MAKRKPPTDAQGDVRELTDADFKTARRFSVLPKTLQGKLKAVRRLGMQKAPTKGSGGGR